MATETNSGDRFSDRMKNMCPFHSIPCSLVIENHCHHWTVEPPTGEGPGGTRLKQRDNLAIAGFALFPLAAVAAILGGLWIMDIADSFDVGTDEETSAREDLRRATEAEFSPHEVAWEKRFRCGPSAMLAEEFQQWVDQGVNTAQPEGNYDTFPAVCCRWKTDC